MCKLLTQMGSLSATVRPPSKVSCDNRAVTDKDINVNGKLARQTSDDVTQGPIRKKLRLEKGIVGKLTKGSTVGSASYTDNDVLSGRGGGTNLHVGNRVYRDLILSHRDIYENESKAKKPGVSRKIVQLIRDQGGRFLRKGKDGLYYDIGDEAAREKTSQALRHRTFEMRNNKDDSKKTKRSSKARKGSEVESMPNSPKATFERAASPKALLQGIGMNISRRLILDEDGNASLTSQHSFQNMNGPEDQKLQQEQQFYRDAFVRQQQQKQQQQQQRDPRQDPVYFQTMLALRQRDLMLANETQVRRFLALKSSAIANTTQLSSNQRPMLNRATSSGLLPSSLLSTPPGAGNSSNSSSQASLSGLVGLNRPDPSLHFLPETLLASSAMTTNRSQIFPAGLAHGERIVRFPTQLQDNISGSRSTAPIPLPESLDRLQASGRRSP